MQQYNIQITNSRTPAMWICRKCYFRELPFASLRHIEDVCQYSRWKTRRVP